MTEFDAILEDIRANPADDLPRLALADWLMEQDDAASRSRGEFIHARCRAASLAPRDPERAALQHRAEALRDEYEVEWLGGLAEHLDGWDFERGMIVAGVSPRAFKRGEFDRLAACEGWKWVIGVRGLALSSSGLRSLLSLFRLARLENVTSLDLRDCEIGRDSATAFQKSGSLSGLVSVNLGYTRIGDRGFRAFFESRYLPVLRILRADNNDIGPDGVVALAAYADCPRLESLDLSRNPIQTRGAIAFARSAHYAGLRELRLCSCGILDRGGIALATSNALANLTLLELSDNSLDRATQAELRERFGDSVVLD